MSILFVHERASFVGGVEQNIADCVRALRRRRIDCHLAYNPMMAVDDSFLALFNSVHACNELSTTQCLGTTPTLVSIATKTESHTAYIHKIPAVPESLLMSGIRTVQMVHDHDLCCPRRHKYHAHNSKVCEKPMGIHCYADIAFVIRDRATPFGIRFESIAAKQKELRNRQRLDLSIVASNFMREELLMNGFDAKRVCTMPLAVPDYPIRNLQPASELPTILYVGQLIRGKGVDQLLRALAELREPYRAVIIGKGNAEHSLRRLASDRGLSQRVEFVGWVANQNLPDYYATADILAIPSRWPEPFGLVGLEAMRYSKPVVAFNVGGIPDWLQHETTGLLAPAGDVNAYAACLARLLADRDLAKNYGAAGALALETEFGFSAYIDRLQEALLPTSHIESIPIQSENAA